MRTHEIIEEVSAGSAVAANISRDITQALAPRFEKPRTETEYRRLKAAAVAALLLKARHLMEEDEDDTEALQSFGQRIVTGELALVE